MPKILPKFNYWEALSVCVTMCMQCMDEIRALSRQPGPAGKDGVNGTNGRDGVDAMPPFDDMKEWYEDDGRIEVRQYFRGGDLWKEFRHKTTRQVYRGVFDTSRTYERGDVVTNGGNQWCCNEESRGALTGEKWTLNLKKGRDARDAK